MNVTNDSWFGKNGEPYLHLALSTFRSIETRIPQLRATHTGITSLIMPDGEIVGASGVFTKEIVHLKVPVLTPPKTLMVTLMVTLMMTLMVILGDWFGYFSFLMAFALGFLRLRGRPGK